MQHGLQASVVAALFFICSFVLLNVTAAFIGQCDSNILG